MSALNEIEIPDGREVSLLITGSGVEAVIDDKRLLIMRNADDTWDVHYDGNYATVNGMTELTHVIERWL